MKDDMTKSAVFADDGHKQDVLPLDFAAEEKAINNNSAAKKAPAAKAETAAAAPHAAKKVKTAETLPPAPASNVMQQVNKPLFQKFESDCDGGAPAVPAFRSAIYPAGYARQMETAAESGKKLMAFSTPPSPAAKNAAIQEPDASIRKTPETVEHSQPERVVAPIQEKKSSHGHRQKNIDIDILFGKLLCDARTRLNISIAQVAQETKIQKEYIEALESEDFNRLPPMVYVCAYVRKLGALYKVEQSKTDEIIESLKKNLEVSLSEEIIANLDIDREHSPESEQKVRSLYWMAAAAVLLFIGLVSIAVLMLMAPDSEARKQTASAAQPNSPAISVPATAPAPAAFDPALLENLKPRQTVPITELSPRH
jgi:cytoskeletal protein RodZ